MSNPIVVCDAGTPRSEWLLARKKLLTASDVAAVLGLHPHKSYNAVMKDKLDDTPPRELTHQAVLAGQFLEEGIFNWFVADRQKHVAGVAGRLDGRLLSAAATPWLGATPDGILFRGLNYHPDEDELVEIKLTGANGSGYWGPDNYKVPRAWAKLELGQYPPCWREAPLHHWVQLQVQMYCAGVSKGWVVGCLGGTKRVDYPYDTDPRFVHTLRAVGAEFMSDWESKQASNL